MKKLFIITLIAISYPKDESIAAYLSQDSLQVQRMNVNVVPLRYSTSNFQTFADSTGIYVKITRQITIADLENLLKAIEVWLEYNRIFKK